MMKLKEERAKETKCAFYPRDVVSAVIATAMWLADWVFVCHTPVLYQNA